MANIRKWLENIEAEVGEQIEALVIGQHYNERYQWPEQPRKLDEDRVITREAGLVKLDYEYDNSYGGADCHPVYAWLPSWIVMIHEYDGATGPVRVPRNPTDCKPEFGGSY